MFQKIIEIYLRITCDPVADFLESGEYILKNHYTIRFRNSKDKHGLKLAILIYVLWWAFTRVALHLQ
jgi:hypothetical protein